MPDEEFIFNKF